MRPRTGADAGAPSRGIVAAAELPRSPSRRRYHCPMPITLGHLRRYAIARSLFKPTTLGARHRETRLRAGGPDPCAGPRPGPDVAPSRRRIPRRRPGAALPAVAARGRLFRQLWLLAAKPPRPHASADAAKGVERCAPPPGSGGVGLRARARHRASARRRCAFCARQGHQLVRRIDQRHHPAAR